MTEPADSGRQAFETHMFACEFDAIRRQHILGEKPQDQIINFSNVVGLACKCDPAEWSDSFAKQRAQISCRKDVDRECILHSILISLRADVIAIIKYHGST